MKTPGRYRDVHENEYHADEAISRGEVVRFMRSRAEWVLGGEDKDSDAFRFGSALHQRVLEEERWDPVVVDVKGTRTKTFKSALSENAGRVVVTADEFEAIEVMAKNVQTHPEYFELLNFAKGETEVSYWWDDPDTGIRCRCRLDYEGPGYAVDVKTTSKLHKFHYAARDYRYDVQAAFYLDGANQHREQPLETMYFIVLQKPPYRADGFDRWAALHELHDNIQCFAFTQESVRAARGEYKEALRDINDFEPETFVGNTGVIYL